MGARCSRKSRPDPHQRLLHHRGGGGAHHQPALHSSSNSVISSVDSSNYDSGAFSRTSTPELSHQFQRLQAQIYQHNLQLSNNNNNNNAKSSLALASPLNAPKLVMQACNIASNSDDDDDDAEESRDSVDAKFILNCLNAASMPSTFQQQQQQQQSLQHPMSHQQQQLLLQSPSRNFQSLNLSSDVSITIGSNTKLTITPNVMSNVTSPSTNLRRSRSGLPVLGTAGLNNNNSNSSCLAVADASTSPMKPARTSRSKISTVYLASPSSLPRTGSVQAIPRELMLLPPSRAGGGGGLNRSESSVTLTNTSSTTTNNQCDPKCCLERVTVNGQHHCGAQQQSLSSSSQTPQPNLKLLPGTSVDSLLIESSSDQPINF